MMGDRVGAYSSTLDCIREILRTEGVLALWRGALPSYFRYGPHFVITFPLYEALRRELGLGYM